MFIDWNTAAVIQYGNGSVAIQDHIDTVAMSAHSLIDAVVDQLPDQVVQTADPDITDVHGGALSHGFQSLEHLYVVGCIIPVTTGCLHS